MLSVNVMCDCSYLYQTVVFVSNHVTCILIVYSLLVRKMRIGLHIRVIEKLILCACYKFIIIIGTLLRTLYVLNFVTARENRTIMSIVMRPNVQFG